MEESPSPSELPPDLDANGRRLFTVNMLTVYREAALANYAEAEELLNRALELRDAGHAMLKRASELAFQQALDMDNPQEPTSVEDDIPW